MRTETRREEGHAAHAAQTGVCTYHQPKNVCHGHKVPQAKAGDPFVPTESNVTAAVIDRRTDQPLGGVHKGVKSKREGGRSQ